MSKLNGRISRLEQQSVAEGEKRRLVLYWLDGGYVRHQGREYTEADLPLLREEYDLIIIRESRQL